MSKLTMLLCSLAVLVISVGLAGCGGEETTTQLSPEEAEIQAELAKLPEADRAAAEKQRTCPVTDGPLGGMGVPVKITVEGRDVFLCCAGCEGAVIDDPDKFLAKLED